MYGWYCYKTWIGEIKNGKDNGIFKVSLSSDWHGCIWLFCQWDQSFEQRFWRPSCERGGEISHDHSLICGIELDVFIYPKSLFQQEYPVEDFVQIWDSRILFDREDVIKNLKQRVNDYIKTFPAKTRTENEHNLAWCQKMLNRTERKECRGFTECTGCLKDSWKSFWYRNWNITLARKNHCAI